MKRVMIMFVIIYGFMYGYRMTEVISEADKNYYMLVRGDGRNDGVDRLYLLDGDTAGTYFEIQEISYKGGDEWEAERVCSLSALPTHFCMGKVRGDDKERLYVTQDSAIYEYEYNNGIWEGREIYRRGNYLAEIISGDCGGGERLYVISQEPDMYKILEIGYDGNEWEEIGEVGIYDNTVLGCVEGRNDDTMRLYTEFGYEITKRGSEWDIEKLSSSLLLHGYIIGKGRGDGLNRMYVRSSYMGYDVIDEYTYGWVQSGKKWYQSYDNVCGDVKWNYGSPFRITIGEVRFDGKSRIYIYGTMYDEGNYKGGLIEYEWNGEDWEYNIMEVPEEVLSSCFYYNTTGDEWSGSGIMITGKLRGDTGSVYILSYYYRSIREWIPDAAGGVEERKIKKDKEDITITEQSRDYVEFEIGITGYADISLYDIQGRKIDDIYSGYVDGNKKITYDWRGLSKGVYFIRAEIGNKNITEKVVKVK